MKKLIIPLLFLNIAAHATITQPVKIDVLVHLPYNLMSDWNQLRYNLAQSVKNVHGNLKLYDNYCKVLNCESDGWTNARNPKSSASGLFQCMASTFKEMQRKGVKITFNQFRRLALKDQARYFDEYLLLYPNKVRVINPNADKQTRQVYAYLMVLKPSCVGKLWNEPVFKRGQGDYNPNKGIPHSNGVITVKDIYKFCLKRFK